MHLLKQSEATAARRRVPVALVDATDGKTPETGVTLAEGDMKVSKSGGAEANHAGTLTELAGGDYYYEFTQAELDTLGYITGRIVKAGVRTFRIAAQVVAFDPYAAAGLGLSNLDAAVSTRASQTSVDDLPTNAELATALAAADDATLAAIAALNDLSAAEVRTELATELGRIDAAVSTRASQASVDELPTNAELATALAAADDATLAAIAGVEAKVDTVDAVVDGIKASTDNLPSDPADQSVVIAATDAIITAVGTRASQASVDDLPTNAELATSQAAADDATLAAIAGVEAKVDTVDTVVDGIKAKTDSLTFDVAGQVNANTTHVNDVEILGDGDETPFGV